MATLLHISTTGEAGPTPQPLFTLDGVGWTEEVLQSLSTAQFAALFNRAVDFESHLLAQLNQNDQALDELEKEFFRRMQPEKETPGDDDGDNKAA